MIIAHNFSAINTSNKLKKISNDKSKSMEKLSSGMKINKASDNSAGLAISESMRSQIRGLDMAYKNMNDGISFFNVGDGALEEVSQMLVRIRELAVQASNDTLTDSDREQLDNESGQLIREIDRIGNDTEFNTIKIFQPDESITKTITTTKGVGAMVSNYTLEDSTIKNILNNASVNVADVQNFYITKVDGTTMTVSFDLGKSIKDNADPNFDSFAHSMYETDGTITQANKDTFVDAFVKGLQSGFDASMSPSTKIDGYFDTNNKMVFTFEDFSNITMACNTASSQSFGHGFLHSMFDSSSFQQNTTTTTTTITEYDKKHLYIQAGANSNEGVDFEWDVLDSKVMKINDLKLKSLTEAQKAIDQCDRATNYVLNIRSAMGAYTNRLEHGIRNVDISSINLYAAESKIRDVDMAKEMMEMNKNSILEQVAQSLLSQANQLPNKVLELLR